MHSYFPPKIRDWRGGPLRVYVQEREVDGQGALILVRHTMDEIGFEPADYAPFGNGFALQVPLASTVEVKGYGEVLIHVGIRSGRACCVGITSSDLDPRDWGRPLHGAP